MRKKSKASSDNKQFDELSEDMEVVGPGQMLSEAREKISLSIEDVAEKLKFKKSLVKDIEQDTFDQKLPATFNRGYLRSYAKLVNVDVDEVLSAYDMLGVAEVQRSEMQSFSNLTEKEAEHSRLMWLSYFIAAILLGLMFLWWQQGPKQAVDESAPIEQSNPPPQSAHLSKGDEAELSESDSKIESTKSSINQSDVESLLVSKFESPEAIKSEVVEVKVEVQEEVAPVSVSRESEKPIIDMSTAVFTFSGDCWVNIFDATGERIAWGVKKSGYVMSIEGKAPLKITLGKPELATIVFNGQPIDMSEFNVGNIAKFTLPLSL